VTCHKKWGNRESHKIHPWIEQNRLKAKPQSDLIYDNVMICMMNWIAEIEIGRNRTHRMIQRMSYLENGPLRGLALFGGDFLHVT
jgi:hypothetical protein